VARVKNIKTINELRQGWQSLGRGAEMGDDAARPAVAVADHGLLLLAFRRDRRKLGPAAHLHAGELQGRRAGPARGRARHDGRLLAAAARRAAAMSAPARPIRSRRRSSRPIISSKKSTAASSSPA
jgi:hypothetical protein